MKRRDPFPWVIRKNVELARQIRIVLSRICPSLPQSVSSGIAVALADLWSVGIEHRKNLRRLVQLSGPKDAEKLDSLVAKFEVSLLFEADHHLKNLKKLIPKLLKVLLRHPENQGNGDVLAPVRPVVRKIMRDAERIKKWRKTTGRTAAGRR